MSDKVTVLYRRYRPSNGSEGMIFEERFCDHCMNNDPDNGCDILMRAFWYQIEAPEYPTEWITDADDPAGIQNPRCTAFKERL